MNLKLKNLRNMANNIGDLTKNQFSFMKPIYFQKKTF